MTSFNVHTVLDAVKSFDYLAAAKLAVPYDEFRSASAANFVTLAHLLIFGTVLGTMIWVTFISGIVLFKNLPKQTFGLAQSYLFPWYFRVCSGCLVYLAVCVFIEQHDIDTVRATFARLFLAADTHASNNTSHTMAEIVGQFLLPFLRLTQANVQIFLLLSAWLTSASQQFIFGPLTTKFMFQRHQLNDQLAKPGKEKDAALLKQLKATNGKFGALHGVSSLLNLYIFVVVLLHGAYMVIALQPSATAASVKVPASKLN
jgi:hypothetical protein